MAVNPNGGFWDSRDGDREYTQEDFNNVITAHFSDGVARLGTQVSVLDSLKPSALGTQVTINAGMVYIAGYWYVSKESQTVDLGANQYLVARLNQAARKIEILSSNTVEDTDVALYGKVEGDMRVESAPILANQQKQVIDTNVGELILDSTSDTYHSLLNVWDSVTKNFENLTVESQWKIAEGDSPFQVCKQGDLLIFRGRMTSGTKGNQNIATLPVGLRPNSQTPFWASGASFAQKVLMNISPTGLVSIIDGFGTNGWLGLNVVVPITQ